MNYSQSEFLELLDEIEDVIDFIYYPKRSHKSMEKKLKGIRKSVKKDGLNSLLKETKRSL